VVAVVLLVAAFEAITPDADDLASSIAFRLVGVPSSDPDDPPNDDVAGDVADPETQPGASESLVTNAPRPTIGCCVGCISPAGRCETVDARTSSSVDSLRPHRRLNC
jgi:hypothetical protein